MIGSSNGEWRIDPTGRYARRWWDGATWTDHVSPVGGVTGLDPAPIGSAEDTGSISSPGAAWAPWVIVTSAAAALGNAIVCGLDLLERHYQQQRLTPHPPSEEHVRHTLQMIRTLSSFTLIAAIAFAVVGITWSVKRRSKARVEQVGEKGVAPALRSILPIVYFTMFAMLVVSLVFSSVARSGLHPGMTINDVVTYRTHLALSAAARAVGWACWIPLVARATQLQAQREAATRSRVAA
jgi:hypothetical protein